MTRFRCWIAAVVVATACQRPAASVQMADVAPPEVGPGASTPHLSVAPDGALWMSWMEPGPDSVWMLRAARRAADGRWGPSRPIVRDSLLFANWADFPSLVVDARGRAVAHYLRRTGAGKYAYHAWITVSADTGRTWSAPQRLHSDSGDGEHGFAALVPQADGSTLAAWLDGRGGGGTHGAMSLGAGGLDSAAHVRPDTLLDIRTCDCCQVAGAALPNGAIVAYRDRSPAEVRDIAVVRRVLGVWSAPMIVHDDGWVTTACPVNGPSLATRGRHVALAWFTNARDTAKVQLIQSASGGESWTAPTRVDDGAPLGRVSAAPFADSSTMVFWLERTGAASAEIRARRVRPDGTPEPALRIAATSDARAAGFPRATSMPDGSVIVAWRAMTTPTGLRLARLTRPGTP